MSITEEFIVQQEKCWTLLKENREALNKVLTRKIDFGKFTFTLQHNPARIVSTAAKTDASSIAQRKCFLCSDNRPLQQTFRKDINGFETLANPFPIFHEHLTIASCEHIPQDNICLAEMAEFSRMYPNLLLFYNASRSGASAPDHLHFQACGIEEMNLPKFLETYLPSDCHEIIPVTIAPLRFWITDMNDSNENKDWSRIERLSGFDAETEMFSIAFRNIMIWRRKTGSTRIVVFPRKRHRPFRYYISGFSQLLISPGAIDIAGQLIIPRENDFHSLTRSDIEEVFNDTIPDSKEFIMLSEYFKTNHAISL